MRVNPFKKRLDLIAVILDRATDRYHIVVLVDLSMFFFEYGVVMYRREETATAIAKLV
jgi:hypothetical protein